MNPVCLLQTGSNFTKKVLEPSNRRIPTRILLALWVEFWTKKQMNFEFSDFSGQKKCTRQIAYIRVILRSNWHYFFSNVLKKPWNPVKQIMPVLSMSFYPDSILILSKIWPDKIWISFRYFEKKIWIGRSFFFFFSNWDKFEENYFIQTLSRFHTDFIHILSGQNLNEIWIKSG